MFCVNCDIEVEPCTSPRRLNRCDLQYGELVELNSSLEIESGVLKEIDKKNVNHSSSLTKKEQEKKLECILVSIMKLSKEFVEIEKKLSVERTENRSANLPYTFFPGSLISFSKTRMQCKFFILLVNLGQRI